MACSKSPIGTTATHTNPNRQGLHRICYHTTLLRPVKSTCERFNAAITLPSMPSKGYTPNLPQPHSFLLSSSSHNINDKIHLLLGTPWNTIAASDWFIVSNDAVHCTNWRNANGTIPPSLHPLSFKSKRICANHRHISHTLLCQQQQNCFTSYELQTPLFRRLYAHNSSTSPAHDIVTIPVLGPLYRSSPSSIYLDSTNTSSTGWL